MFDRLTKFCDKIREDAKSGKIETFILDPVTMLAENRWIYINVFEQIKTAKGALDTRSMYGNLGRWLYKFILTEVLTIPCNVIITVHEQEEQEEDDKGKTYKTGKIEPAILGGFRDRIAGMVNAHIFLELKRDQGKYRYIARCMPSITKRAKNNLGLPEIVEDISYQKIMDNIKGVQKLTTANNKGA